MDQSHPSEGDSRSAVEEISSFLGVLHALAWAKTLLACPFLSLMSVDFFLGTRRPARRGVIDETHNCNNRE
jgi:hypothetical protein